MDLDKKYSLLKTFIKSKGKNGVVIAFSGGVDSSTLAAISYNILGKQAVAVSATSATYSSKELKEAKKIAKEIGIKHYFIEEHSLSNQDFIKNPLNRCYYCKRELLKSLRKFASKIRFSNSASDSILK